MVRSLVPRSWSHGLAVAVVAATSFVAGCGGHVARTEVMRTALDANSPKAAIAAIDVELDVKGPEDLPVKIEGDNALLVLDRASIQQSLTEFKWSKRDYEAADKAIKLSRDAHKGKGR